MLARTHAGIGSALSQVAETLTRPLTGKVREDEERYRLRFEVPGLGKDDVRVYVDDGVLHVTVPRSPERKRSVTEVKVR